MHLIPWVNHCCDLCIPFFSPTWVVSLSTPSFPLPSRDASVSIPAPSPGIGESFLEVKVSDWSQQGVLKNTDLSPPLSPLPWDFDIYGLVLLSASFLGFLKVEWGFTAVEQGKLGSWDSWILAASLINWSQGRWSLGFLGSWRGECGIWWIRTTAEKLITFRLLACFSETPIFLYGKFNLREEWRNILSACHAVLLSVSVSCPLSSLLITGEGWRFSREQVLRDLVDCMY